MKKVISFSLWGNSYRYLGGSIQNVELAKKIYPDWICRFYIGDSTNENFVKILESYDNVEIIKMNLSGNWSSMTWRFLSVCDDSVDIMMSRDADSRITLREKKAVEEWLNSEKKFHIMRDNPNHNTLIMGGMWGCKKGLLNNMKELIDNYNPGDFWQSDQNFLKSIVYPIIKDDCLVHDGFLNYEIHRKKFTSERNPLHFVGQAYDGDGKILDRDEYFQNFYNEINLTKYIP